MYLRHRMICQIVASKSIDISALARDCAEDGLLTHYSRIKVLVNRKQCADLFRIEYEHELTSKRIFEDCWC